MFDKTAMIGYLIALAGLAPLVAGQCIADETINTQFALLFSDGESEAYEVPEGSCCQETICGLGCPEEVDEPDKGTRNQSRMPPAEIRKINRR
jgi:hypothetical protein